MASTATMTTLPNPSVQPRRLTISGVLWIVQVLLALLYLFTGGLKVTAPMEEMAKQMPVPLPFWFVRFIGAAEILGALGLVLPSLLRIWPGLTPLAAAGLVIIMIGATVVTVMFGTIGSALMPLLVGLLAAFVAYGRWRLAPVRGHI
jgi:DoxX-like protein